MTLNPDPVRARCGGIDAALTRLEQFRRRSGEDFLSSQDQLDIACTRFQKSMPAVLPCFTKLESSLLTSQRPFNTWLDFETCSSMCMGPVGYNQVYDIIGTRLDDLRLFSSAIAGRL